MAASDPPRTSTTLTDAIHAGGPAPRLDEAGLGAPEGLAIEADGRTLAEYAAGPRERVGAAASAPAVCRAPGKLGLRREKRPARRGAGPAGPRAGAIRGADRAGR